jgi:hypothetical protein
VTIDTPGETSMQDGSPATNLRYLPAAAGYASGALARVAVPPAAKLSRRGSDFMAERCHHHSRQFRITSSVMGQFPGARFDIGVVERLPGDTEFVCALPRQGLAQDAHGNRRLVTRHAAQQGQVSPTWMQAKRTESGNDPRVLRDDSQARGQEQVDPAPTAPPRTRAPACSGINPFCLACE